jgi:hypothetical protein
MITSFFKPNNNSQKVRPVSSRGSTGPSEPNKRDLDEDTKKEKESNKRSKLGDSSTSKTIVNSEAQELLTYLDRHESDETTTWMEVLEKHFSSPSFERLAKFVSQQR